MTISPEDAFTTTDSYPEDATVTFSLVEGADGDVWWGYGHVDPRSFVAEVNAWLIHCGLDHDELIEPESWEQVEHLHVRWPEDEYTEELTIVTEHVHDAGVIPVTRLAV